MAIQKSSEFPGFAFDYDPAKNPFFKAMVKENLRKLSTWATGKVLLKAIRDARPGKRPNGWPSGVNVVLQPPLDKQMIAPGLGKSGGTIVVRNNQAFMDWDNRINGGMIATLTAKTAAAATDRACSEVGLDNKPSIGCGCFVNFSNIEIRSKSGQWLPADITMGHELIHCWHMLNGSGRRDNKEEEYMTVGIKGFEGMPITENRLRQEAGYPKRDKYFADD
jgi:hypothetical protein